MKTSTFATGLIRIMATGLVLVGLGQYGYAVRAQALIDIYDNMQAVMAENLTLMKEINTQTKEMLGERAPRVADQEKSNTTVIPSDDSLSIAPRLKLDTLFFALSTVVGLLFLLFSKRLANIFVIIIGEELDAKSAIRFVLKVIGIYFLVSVIVGVFWVSFSISRPELIELGVVYWLSVVIGIAIGLTFLLADKLIARWFLWRVS